MKALLFVAMMAMTLLGCEKEYEYPVPTLIGVWVSTEPAMQLPIANTTGEGKFYQFLEYKKEGKHYLKLTMDMLDQTFLVRGLTMKEMVLVDLADVNQKDIRFYKSDLPLIK